MTTRALHTSLYIACSLRIAPRRPVSTPLRDGWLRAGAWFVAAGERATHHRMGSWTRR